MCAVSPKIDEVLRITRLNERFLPYDTEAAAITGVHRADPVQDAGADKTTVLCVDASTDVGAYLRELLKAAGYRVLTANNLPDALMSSDRDTAECGRGGRGTGRRARPRTSEEFHRLAAARAVVLPQGFSGREAGEAADVVLRAVGALC